MALAAPATASSLDAEALRLDFPALHQRVHGRRLVYLDNAASSQTPRPVIDAIVEYYERDRANVHRGVHELSQRATDKYESARVRLQRFLNAAEPEEIVWTKGTTESINLVAESWGRTHVGPGDDVVISAMEHHSNIVPWQILCEEKGANLRVIPMDRTGTLQLSALGRPALGAAPDCRGDARVERARDRQSGPRDRREGPCGRCRLRGGRGAGPRPTCG